jgi:hypothetical protein
MTWRPWPVSLDDRAGRADNVEDAESRGGIFQQSRVWGGIRVDTEREWVLMSGHEYARCGSS